MHAPPLLIEVAVGFDIMFFLTLVSRWLAAVPRFSSPTTYYSKAAQQPLLRLNGHNEFHIAIFADLHYGEEEGGWGINQDVNSTRVMNDILGFEDPDFVILSTTPPIYPHTHLSSTWLT
jgi:hypothetical protein